MRPSNFWGKYKNIFKLIQSLSGICGFWPVILVRLLKIQGFSANQVS